MRLNIVFNTQDKFIIPISYNHILQAIFYQSLQDANLAKVIHDEGFGDNRKFKLFTFSYLKGNYTYDNSKTDLTFIDDITWEISSVDQNIITLLYNNFCSVKFVTIKGQKLFIKHLELFDFPIDRSIIDIEMLSPIVVYKTFKQDDKNTTIYFNPLNNEFKQLINSNIRNKLKSVGIQEAVNDIDIIINDLGVKDERIHKYKNTIIKGWMGKYRLIGDSDILKFIYDVGIGSKNSQGFGMFKIKD